MARIGSRKDSARGIACGIKTFDGLIVPVQHTARFVDGQAADHGQYRAVRHEAVVRPSANGMAVSKLRRNCKSLFSAEEKIGVVGVNGFLENCRIQPQLWRKRPPCQL